MPENGLAGAAALVTGASRGFGRGIATRTVRRARPPLPSHADRKVPVRATGGPSVATRWGHVRFVAGRAAAHTSTTQVRANANLYLAVCRAHGAAYAYHHYRLLRPFLSAPARQSPSAGDLTSGGPPLETVIAGLQRLCDLRDRAGSARSDHRPHLARHAQPDRRCRLALTV